VASVWPHAIAIYQSFALPVQRCAGCVRHHYHSWARVQWCYNIVTVKDREECVVNVSACQCCTALPKTMGDQDSFFLLWITEEFCL